MGSHCFFLFGIQVTQVKGAERKERGGEGRRREERQAG